MQATYITNNSFSVSGNRTLEFVEGRRVKATHSDSTQYCTIYSSTVSGSYTIVTLKENELTSNLASVLYGIIEPGISGSLPDHTHDGTEGSGGTISGGGSSDVQTFLDLTDTPASYGSAGKYLTTATSGVEFSDPESLSVARGTQSCKVEYKDADEIYINPGVIHIDDGSSEDYYKVSVRLTKQLIGLSTNTWYYIYATNSGTTMRELTTSNIEYSTTVPSEDLDRMGYYHTTSSGWRCVGFVYADSSSNIKAYDVGGSEYIFDQVITCLTWATYSSDQEFTVNYVPLAETPVTLHFRGAYNTGTASIYAYTPSVTTTTARFVGVVTTSSYYASVVQTIMCNSSKQVGMHATAYNTYMGAMINSFTIPAEIYTGPAAFATTQDDDVISLYEGVQSCRVLYATASGVYVNPGKVEINSTLYKVTSQITKLLTSLTASNWYYIYVKPPSSGKIISSAEIEYTTTAPTENLAKMGYYHGTNTTWRCIGVVYASATDTVFEFDTERGFYRYYEQFLNYSTTITTSWVTVTFTAPAFAKFIQTTFRASTYNVNGHIRYRHYGSSGKHFVLEYNSTGRSGYNTSLVKCDSSQRGQVYCSGAGTNGLYIYANGFMLPDSIYTGV